jgi:hypothetical protein
LLHLVAFANLAVGVIATWSVLIFAVLRDRLDFATTGAINFVINRETLGWLWSRYTDPVDSPTLTAAPLGVPKFQPRRNDRELFTAYSTFEDDTIRHAGLPVG